MVSRHTGCLVDADNGITLFPLSCFLGASLWRFSEHIRLEETLCQTQNSLQGLCVLSGLEIPLKEQESVAAGEKHVWVFFLGQLPLWRIIDKCYKMDNWMGGCLTPPETEPWYSLSSRQQLFTYLGLRTALFFLRFPSQMCRINWDGISELELICLFLRSICNNWGQTRH